MSRLGSILSFLADIAIEWLDEDEKSGTHSPYGPGRRRTTDPPPGVTGDYLIFDEDGRKKYHGYSTDIRRRRGEHQRSGRYSDDDRFEWRPAKEDATLDEIRKWERRKIDQYKPWDNRSRGGEGRKPKS